MTDQTTTSVGQREFLLVREPDLSYCAALPRGATARTVRKTWSLEASRCRVAVEKILPDVCAELYVNLGPSGRHLVTSGAEVPAAARRDAWVVGPHASSIFVAKETRDCDIVAIRLQAGAIPRALGVPAGEIAGRLVDLASFWGERAVQAIRERLFLERDPLSRATLLETEVARRAGESCMDDDTMRNLRLSLEAVPSASIASVAKRHGLSHRAVIRLFDVHIGVKPKEYQRVQRLRQVLARASSGRIASWAQLACEVGYCDQAHLAHEFRQLTGLTPSAYLETRSRLGAGAVPHVLAGT